MTVDGIKKDAVRFELYDGGHCYLRVLRMPGDRYVVDRWPHTVGRDLLVELGAWAEANGS
jgi:hypothetical protein